MKRILFLLLFPCFLSAQTAKDTLVLVGSDVFLQRIITTQSVLVDTAALHARSVEINNQIDGLEAEQLKIKLLIAEFIELTTPPGMMQAPAQPRTTKQPATKPKTAKKKKG